ncbi:ATP-NAD kinase family protein [Agarilytica rhodophyticola]|uniref:ATP-NAD kinase family protein n=1 Tax=Agarilytica rhodophyticola TaxID=1737490 RepID=UPI000B345975|nr:ATP-NAD kinase family protein [Agarilytica rhodophyticola]
MTKYSIQQPRVEKVPLRLGFVINPYAGAGGPAGLKGSDSSTTRKAVVDGEIKSRAPERALQFISALTSIAKDNTLQFVTLKGAMGENAFLAAGMQVNEVFHLLDIDFPEVTRAEDTQIAVDALLAANIDMLVFVGGDGTARDVCSVIGHKLPVLGVPSGVKMHSGVFAITPQGAAMVIDDLAATKLVSLTEQEVRDIDEDAFQKGVVKSRYFGSMIVPDEIRYVQSVKQGGVEVDELVLMDIAAEIRERLEEPENQDALVIFATGSTTQFIQQELGCEGTLLGVDIYFRGELIALDVSAEQLEHRISEHQGKVIIVLTAIGGQGHIIGRGNQQLSPIVLRRCGRDNLWLVATKSKLEALNQRPLLIDSNDAALDQQWQGLIPVITGYHDQVLYCIGGVNACSE